MLKLPLPKVVASFDVDAQCCFTPLCPNELPVPEGNDIAPFLNAQAQHASLRIGSKDAHSPSAIWVSNEEHPPLSPLNAEHSDVYWPLHAVPGTLGFESLPGLPPVTEYDFFVWKGVEPHLHPYGACYHDLHEMLSTGVIEFLRARAIECVLVGGLATDYCVKHTALQLRRAGFRVVVNLSACRGVDPKTTQEAIEQLRYDGCEVVPCIEPLEDR